MDKIVYTDDWKDLEAKLGAEGNALNFTHTPFIVNGNEAIALVRGGVPRELRVLGTYDEVFADKTSSKLYKKLCGSLEKIGEFA